MGGWEIMWTESDVEMTVPIVDKYTALFPNLSSISFDRGYWSVPNFEVLRSRELEVILPGKGYKNREEQVRESAEEFRQKRRRHAQVEFCINGLWSSMAGPAFGPREARQDLLGRSGPMWWRPICVGLGAC